jgi:hypothetical protein
MAFKMSFPREGHAIMHENGSGRGGRRSVRSCSDLFVRGSGLGVDEVAFARKLLAGRPLGAGQRRFAHVFSGCAAGIIRVNRRVRMHTGLLDAMPTMQPHLALKQDPNTADVCGRRLTLTYQLSNGVRPLWRTRALGVSELPRMVRFQIKHHRTISSHASATITLGCSRESDIHWTLEFGICRRSWGEWRQ